MGFLDSWQFPSDTEEKLLFWFSQDKLIDWFNPPKKTMRTELSQLDKTKIYFTADNGDEIFLLGQLKQIFSLF